MSLFRQKKVYDIVYSFGVNCAAASFLNNAFLRRTSGPFDWFGNQRDEGSFESRVELICSHFAGFLQKENLVPLAGESELPRDPLFEFYLDNGGAGFNLPHEFPVGEPMEKNYEFVKAKYDRRIARFYENIQQCERVLLVWICYSDTGCEVEGLVPLCGRICEALGKTVDFLLIWQDSSMGLEQAAAKQELAPNITLWRANIYREPSGNRTDYLGAQHLIAPIFRDYALAGTGAAVFRARMRGLFGRVLGALIPVRSWRKRVRAYFIYNEFNHDVARDLNKRG